MKTFDLIPNIDELETLFIMESPYIDELKKGIPVSGSTGKRMALEILGNENESFGELLKKNDSNVSKYGVMNSFPFALGLVSNLPENQQEFAQIKNIKYTNRNTFYQDHLALLATFTNLEEETAFKARLIEYISNAPKLTNLVFCGYIAQSMYLHSFKQPIFPYNRITLIKTKRERKTYILFVNHPSEKNKVWDFKVECLK